MFNRRAKSFSTAAHGLKWHKFMLFCMLLGAIFNFLSAPIYIFFDLYGEHTERVYTIYPALAFFNVFMGLLSIGVAVFQLVVRNRLKNFYEVGPKLLLANYAILIVTNLVSSIVPVILAPHYSEVVYIDYFALIFSLLAAIAEILINYFYYKKRKYMFTK